MLINFLELTREHEEVGDEVRAAVESVHASGIYILGDEVEAFEREWASYCGVPACAGTASGTDALTLALLASGAVRPGRGDEVITTSLTAGYTGLAILNAGAVPVFADIDAKTYTLAPDKLERVRTARTRAIVPVHLYGQMADMEAISDFSARHDLFIIEDAAQAHGARLGGKRAGAWGHAAAFSFYPTKNLGAYGDGGAVTSTDARLIERVRELRQGGHARGLKGELAGINSRLDEVQAAALRIKLKYLDGWNRRRRALADMYRRLLLRSDRGLVVPAVRAGSNSHVNHLYVVRCRERDRLREHLAERGIETLIHYPLLLHQQPLFQRGSQPELPEAEAIAHQIFSLPLYPQLRDEELHVVAEAIHDFEVGNEE